jgi:integration host factor subunit alpha
MKLLKKDLIARTAQACGESRATVSSVLDSMSDVVKEHVAQGDEVMLAGLGTLSVRARPARPARHMRTGERVIVPARNVVTLRPSVSLQRAVNS